MIIVYKPWGVEALEQYRCRLSGRQAFDSYEANYKCAWLVRQQHAEFAMAFNGEELFSRWEWNATTREAVQKLGPDL